jgi:hypothetical protein
VAGRVKTIRNMPAKDYPHRFIAIHGQLVSGVPPAADHLKPDLGSR